jgi:signal transduction histidine kinase
LSTRLGHAAGEDSRKYLSSIQKAANRLQALIKDLLALSKISKDEDFLASCDLNKVLEAVIRELDWKIKEKNARMLVDPLPSIPGNRNLLESMFSNLIENALKYSKEDTPPVITIRYQEVIPVITEGRESPRRDFCRVLVQDNGIGFEQKYADHIFSMFRRLHNPDEFDGTGIGLALCKKIVDRHNGYISAQSEPNKGSTFIVSLPAHSTRTTVAVV